MTSPSLSASLAALLLLGLIGCNQRKAPQSAETLRARLGAAQQIIATSDRDSALASVASDAADLGFGDIVKEAINGIVNISDRDTTAEDCSRRLAKAGKLAMAKDVAELITSISSRDDALKAIAKDNP